jgi:hypothetical protein
VRKLILSLVVLSVVAAAAVANTGITYGKGTFITTKGLTGYFDFWVGINPTFMSRFKVCVDFGADPPGKYKFAGSWPIAAGCNISPGAAYVVAGGLWNGYPGIGALGVADNILGADFLAVVILDVYLNVISYHVGIVTSGSLHVLCK